MKLKKMNTGKTRSIEIKCSMSAGIIKPFLTGEDKDQFKSLFKNDYTAGEDLLIEGKNSMIFCFSPVGIIPDGEIEGTCGTTIVAINAEDSIIESLKIQGKSTENDHRNAAIRHSPESIMDKLNYSWSLAYVDDVSGHVCIGRDEAGAQSMYYMLCNNMFYFASSISCFQKLSLTVNPEAVYEFLHFLYIPAPHTIYKDVKSVLPGRTVYFNGKTLHEDKVFRHKIEEDEFAVPVDLPGDQYLYSFEEHLIRSLQKICPENKRAILLLSGGKDSSVLAIALKKGGFNNIEAITLGFEDDVIDESNDARIVAQHLGLPYRIFKFEPARYLKHWPGFIQSLGQPIGDPAALPIYALMTELQDSYDIYIDGTGNDRYMGITTTWHENLVWNIYRFIPWVHYLPWHLMKSGFSYTVSVMKDTFCRPKEEQFVSWRGWTSEEICKLTGRRPDWSAIPLYQIHRDSESSMFLKTRTLCDIWEPETAYRKTVQIAGVLGKTVYFPYLDKELVHYCESLPSKFRHQRTTNKVILRMLLRKYLPPEIFQKKKGAFNFPKEYVLSWNNYSHVRNLLSTDRIGKYSLMDQDVVRKYVDRYINGEKKLEDRIWALSLLYAWLEIGNN